MAAGVLLSLLLGLLVHGAWRVGPTYDEHFYIASGYAYLQDGEFALNREHPPLLKLMAGLPLLLLGDIEFRSTWQDLVNYPVSFFFGWNGATQDRNLFLARLPFCALSVLLAYVCYRVARRRFGNAGGLAALQLVGFNPNLIAHGRLAALDAGTAAFLFFAAIAGLAAFERPRPSATLRAAVLFGLACLTKYTALLLVPLLAGIAVVHALRDRALVPLGRVVLIFSAGLGVFAAGYAFEFRSYNEALSSHFLVVGREVEATEPPTLEQLVGRLREALGPEVELPDRVRAELADTATPQEWVEAFARWMRTDLEPAADAPALGAGTAAASAEQPPDSEDRALSTASEAVLRSLAEEVGPVRRAAFGAVLAQCAGAAQMPDEGAPTGPSGHHTRCLELLRRLADAQFANLAAARAFWARYAGEEWDRTIFNRGWVRALTRGIFGDEREIPLFSALAGLDKQLVHSGSGHVTSFRGKLLEPSMFAAGNPHPEYYSVVMAVKNPPTLFALIALGLASLLLRRRGVSFALVAVLLVFPVLVFGMFSTSRLLMGVKYLLPLMPFVGVLAARGATLFPRVCVGLAAVAAIEGVALQPHQLMYYNLFAGGPTGGPEITVIGDDWGQDVRTVGRFYARHREAIGAAGGLFYSPYTVAPASAFGLEEAQTLYPGARGIVAVGLADRSRRPEFYAWLADFEPFRRLGWSILLYDTRPGVPGGQPDWR